MGRNMRITTATTSNRAPLLLNNHEESSRPSSDLEEGNEIQPGNVGFCRVLRLAKPDAGKLALATIALLIASLSNILILLGHYGEENRRSRLPRFLANIWHVASNYQFHKIKSRMIEERSTF
ncbi:ABC transporter B family member 25-like isoform X2 [Ananas comosus]|uniref:ABC transporter B family member 25-like isoform X2 n=1 Tax=Ananas comosus TaxID=4615 RepID=A0A6P5FQE3_ANACO|nr:ABC transporter B family member 25-like isoform X2 [Ananas comosus]